MQLPQRVVEDAGVRVVHQPPHDADHHLGHRPGHQRQRAGQPAQPQVLVEQQRQAQRQRQLERRDGHRPHQADPEGVPEERIQPEVAEVGQAGEGGGAGDAGLRVGEGQREPVQQRSHAQHQDGDQRREQQEPGVLVQAEHPAPGGRRPGRRRAGPATGPASGAAPPQRRGRSGGSRHGRPFAGPATRRRAGTVRPGRPFAEQMARARLRGGLTGRQEHLHAGTFLPSGPMSFGRGPGRRGTTVNAGAPFRTRRTPP